MAGLWLLTVSVVIGGSLLSVWLWEAPSEQLPEVAELSLEEGMTISDIGRVNDVPERVLRRAFRLQDTATLDQTPSQLGFSSDEAVESIRQSLVLAAESGSKDWQKIYIKFGLWFLFLGLVLFVTKSGRLTASRRRWLYLAAILTFGVVLGADPSPMGTVKDAIVLFGAYHVVFLPRLIALGVFLLMVVVANKYICSWGCQIGSLQDLIFRLNRDRRDRKGLVKQWKPPFWLSNTVRVGFLAALITGALAWQTDLVEHIDPFKIFKPAKLDWIGMGFVGLVLVASLFVYRPWCHFFCPFGLVGWVFEKLSVLRIKVDYQTCIACEACTRACPSTVMSAILRRDRATIPDCFSCGVCLEACPTDSIQLALGRRGKPPEGWPAFKVDRKDRKNKKK